MTTALTARPPQASTDRAATAVPRLDLYAPIHKALRSLMTHTLGRVGRVDVGDERDLRDTLNQVDELLTFCEKHIEHENDFVHPAIEARQLAGARRIADEHEEHLASIAALRCETAALRCSFVDQRAPLALGLYRHLALFVAENFQHMHVEETAHNAALWAHYSDAELMELHQRLLASISPQENLIVARWMIPAVSPTERAIIMNGMKSEAPPEAFLGVLDIVRPHLGEQAWKQLLRAVGVMWPLRPFAVAMGDGPASEMPATSYSKTP
jgi:hypothetical protein